MVYSHSIVCAELSALHRNRAGDIYIYCLLIPVLYVIGMLLKKIPNIKDWLIPWILLGLGMIGGFFLSGMQLSGILQGVLVTGVTVFANQLYKQTIVKSKGGGDSDASGGGGSDASGSGNTGSSGSSCTGGGGDSDALG